MQNLRDSLADPTAHVIETPKDVRSMVAWSDPDTIRVQGKRFADGTYRLTSLDFDFTVTGDTIKRAFERFMEMLVMVRPQLAGQKRNIIVDMTED